MLYPSGVPWARIGEAVGHDLVKGARRYTDVMTHGQELDYATIIART